VCSDFWLLVQILCSFYGNRFESLWARSVIFQGAVPLSPGPLQDSLFCILTAQVLVELPVMMKFGNIGVFVGFQGDTQLRKIRTQISFSLVPVESFYTAATAGDVTH